MAVRWDAIFLATAVAGGSMLIENSHRLDTGAPDEEVVATSTCTAVVSARAWKADGRPGADEATEEDAAQLAPGCAPD